VPESERAAAQLHQPLAPSWATPARTARMSSIWKAGLTSRVARDEPPRSELQRLVHLLHEMADPYPRDSSTKLLYGPVAAAKWHSVYVLLPDDTTLACSSRHGLFDTLLTHTRMRLQGRYCCQHLFPRAKHSGYTYGDHACETPSSSHPDLVSAASSLLKRMWPSEANH
jgi:hypothetical protein